MLLLTKAMLLYLLSLVNQPSLGFSNIFQIVVCRKFSMMKFLEIQRGFMLFFRNLIILTRGPTHDK